MQLTESQMKHQVQYESVLFFLDKMLSDDILTASEYEEAKEYLREKYTPVIRH